MMSRKVRLVRIESFCFADIFMYSLEDKYIGSGPYVKIRWDAISRCIIYQFS